MSNACSLSVVVPVFNEEKLLELNCAAFAKVFNEVVGKKKWQFVFVGNGSTDRSREICEKLANIYFSSNTLCLDKSNYGAALKAGVLDSQGEFILIMNADHLLDKPAIIWSWNNRRKFELILISKRADPTLNSQHIYRKMLSEVLNFLLSLLFDFVGRDTHGMKLMNAKSAVQIATACQMTRGQFDTELTLRFLASGQSVVEIPTLYSELRSPRNFMLRKILQNIFDIIRLRKILHPLGKSEKIEYSRLSRSQVVSSTSSKQESIL